MFFSFCLWMFSSPSIIYLEINNALLFLYSVDFVFWKKSIVHTYHDPDNHDGVITHLEPDILECEVMQALGSITMNKTSGGDGIPVELFQTLKDDAVKVMHSICQQIWKIQQWPQDWKSQFSFQYQRKAMPKNTQTIHNCTHLTR